MGTALYTQASNAGDSVCPLRHANIPWSQDLPPTLKDLVLTPVHFDVARDYEMRADHTHGRDAANRPCFSEFRFILTQLRSDDDEVFYEVPVYAESQTAWRLVDERWLVCRTRVGHDAHADSQTSLTLSDAMPR